VCRGAKTRLMIEKIGDFVLARSNAGGLAEWLKKGPKSGAEGHDESITKGSNSNLQPGEKKKEKVLRLTKRPGIYVRE